MEVCTNGKICVLLSVLLYCYSSTLSGNANVAEALFDTKIESEPIVKCGVKEFRAPIKLPGPKLVSCTGGDYLLDCLGDSAYRLSCFHFQEGNDDLAGDFINDSEDIFVAIGVES